MLRVLVFYPSQPASRRLRALRVLCRQSARCLNQCVCWKIKLGKKNPTKTQNSDPHVSPFKTISNSCTVDAKVHSSTILVVYLSTLGCCGAVAIFRAVNPSVSWLYPLNEVCSRLEHTRPCVAALKARFQLVCRPRSHDNQTVGDSSNPFEVRNFSRFFFFPDIYFFSCPPVIPVSQLFTFNCFHWAPYYTGALRAELQCQTKSW